MIASALNLAGRGGYGSHRVTSRYPALLHWKEDERFSYPGFGTFVVRTRKARKGRNPKTGAEITIAESSTVGFKPAKNLKDLIS